MDRFTIEKNIIIKSSPENVFEMLTNSDEIIKYYPLNEVVSEWKVGSEVLYKGEINNNKFTDYGVINIITRPKKYMYTYWSDNHGTENTPENQITISYNLSKVQNGTKLELIQTNIHSKEMFEMMDTTVWPYLLNSLKTYIESNT